MCGEGQPRRADRLPDQLPSSWSSLVSPWFRSPALFSAAPGVNVPESVNAEPSGAGKPGDQGPFAACAHGRDEQAAEELGRLY